MSGQSWQAELAARIRDPNDLPPFIRLTEEERTYFASPRVDAGFALAVPPHYIELLRASAEAHGGVLPVDDPLRRQAIPTHHEYEILQYELLDPLGEDSHTVAPRVIHRYRDRVLMLVTDECALHCRHCFRRRFTGSTRGAMTEEELAAAVSYVGKHREIDEVLLSGGDALLLPDAHVERIVSALRRIPRKIVLRIATRSPVVMPSRITDRLLSILNAAQPIWLVTQFNHPAELGAASVKALARIVKSGIPILNQTVLLRGVNDDAAVLAELCRLLVQNRVKPYYLFQGDLAPGTKHFRTSITQGLQLVRDLRSRVSGLAMPVYAVDIPGGGGKVRLETSALQGESGDAYELLGSDGSTYHYPKEIP